MKNFDPAHMEDLLRSLPEAADKHMKEVSATPDMKARIVTAASQPAKRSFVLPAWMPAVCCAMVLALFLILNPAAEQPVQLIHSQPAGQATVDPAASMTADLNGVDVKIVRGNSNPGYRDIWAETTGGSFPLIGVNGKYYRLLTGPREVDRSLLGGSLGAIAEYTTEPSLSGTNVILSNAAAFGSDVYAIRGMEGTLVAAEVNGAMRLFQRVSYNGNALRGRETLADTLQLSGHVVALELSGVGTVTDPALCNALLETLLENASYKSSGSVSSRQSLLLELDNGLVLQMAVKNDRLAACGVWSCPEFFEAFEAACN